MLKIFSGKISCFLASNFVSLAEPMTSLQTKFESVIVGQILSQESYLTSLPAVACISAERISIEKQHFSVARVATHTKENISKFERHDERKNTTYSNGNIVTERTPMNIYFKRYDSTLNQKFDEMVKYLQEV